MDSRRSLVFAIGDTDPSLTWLMAEFRLIVNKAIRIALRNDVASRTRLAKLAYNDLSREHRVYKQYIPSAFEVALGELKAYHRRMRKGRKSAVPYHTKLMLKAENQSYRLNRETGQISIPIRAGERVTIDLRSSSWHRSFLEDPAWRLGSLTLTPGRLILAVRRSSPQPYSPKGAIALDTNEDSLDGVMATTTMTRLVSSSLGRSRQIQATHFRRRRRLMKKKEGDTRVRRRLLAHEGQREHNRVRQRLHLVSCRLVRAAAATKAAIVLEDLTLHGAGGRSRRMNRRLSSWPRGELHRQIEYKAAQAGVPVIKVNPAWTSKTCPVCGARRRDRVGQDFVCLVCDWEMDRQHNAACNILLSAIASHEALARAVRFRPGALRDDVVSPLYDPCRGGGGAREEPSGVESCVPALL